MSGEVVVWHDAECGGYSADLALWERLATEHGAPILELGAGTGRVALHLGRRGLEVDAIELDPELAGALRSRAREAGLPVRVEVGDARELDLSGRGYSLVIAAMQLIQLLGGPGGRAALYERVARCLAPGGMAAFAIVDDVESVVGEAGAETVPDVRERDGWVHASLPVDVVARNGRLVVRRLRQTVSPGGGMEESEHLDELDLLDAAVVEAEGAVAGLIAAGRRPIEQSDMHVGSTIVLLRKEA